jgi:NAD(P)-dependent dehydrogenase (short-subunit alcohol dehydrogenase family)
MSETIFERSVLILGASRGIGLGLVREYLARGWQVIATQRQARSDSSLARLAETSHGALQVETVDINDRDGVICLANQLNGHLFDLLFVVAGVSDDPKQTIAQISTEEFVSLMVTNALSPLRCIEALAHLVKQDGSIAVLSSALGSISGNTDGGFEAYRASKAALNMLLRSYAARVKDRRSLLALMPGWVKTEMGGPDALVEVSDSASELAATIAKHERQPGLVFVDYQDQAISW